MSAQAWADLRVQAGEVKIRIEQLARPSQRQLLYPIWEMHTVGILQPVYRLQQEHDEGAPASREEHGTRFWKGLHFHPFNFEDEEVNLDRATKLLTTMEPLRHTISTGELWWPQDAGALVEAVKREREEMDAYGYIGQNQAAGLEDEDKTEQSALKRKRNDSTPPRFT